MSHNRKKIFFFFPYYHAGGAEKVHLQIVKCFSDYECYVFFTDRSKDDRYKKEFRKHAVCFRLFGVTNKIKFLEKISVSITAFMLNRMSGVVIFGSNSRFFYALLGKLNGKAAVVDLVHWLDGAIGRLALDNTERIDRRIIVTGAMRPLLVSEYEKRGQGSDQIKKVKLIENCVPGASKPNKDFSGKLKILYVGRNTHEKRAELAVSVRQKLKDNNDFDFTFVGRGLKKIVPDKNIVHELINSEQGMNRLYENAHVLILTSLFEGFPCVIMEAMNWAVVPVATAVGGIPEHLRTDENAILIENVPEKIVGSMVTCLLRLDHNRDFLESLSDSAYEYARKNFSCDNFTHAYRDLIVGLSQAKHHEFRSDKTIPGGRE